MTLILLLLFIGLEIFLAVRLSLHFCRGEKRMALCDGIMLLLCAAEFLLGIYAGRQSVIIT